MPKVKKKISRPAAVNLAILYINKCRQKNIPISTAILFGSQATGTAHGDSDIDLLLVSNRFTQNTLENWKMLAPITAHLYEVEPHPYPEENFKRGDPFIDEIKRTGIEIKV